MSTATQLFLYSIAIINGTKQTFATYYPKSVNSLTFLTISGHQRNIEDFVIVKNNQKKQYIGTLIILLSSNFFSSRLFLQLI
jgi:hypothetical protein